MSWRSAPRRAAPPRGAPSHLPATSCGAPPADPTHIDVPPASGLSPGTRPSSPLAFIQASRSARSILSCSAWRGSAARFFSSQGSAVRSYSSSAGPLVVTRERLRPRPGRSSPSRPTSPGSRGRPSTASPVDVRRGAPFGSRLRMYFQSRGADAAHRIDVHSPSPLCVVKMRSRCAVLLAAQHPGTTPVDVRRRPAARRRPTSVGSKSTNSPSRRCACPAATLPGHTAIIGVRMPAS